MSKFDLIKLLAKKKPNLTSEELTKIVDLVFSSMANALKDNQRIEIRGLGSFFVRVRKARNNARDPRTGKIITIGERHIPSFRIGKGFYNKINSDQPKA